MEISNGMKKVVTIGGGTGSYAVLRALKIIPDISISAIVPVSDSGGSTGKLRKQYQIAAVGDARQALVALSDVSGIEEKMNKRDSDGHALGNLILAEFEKMHASPTSSMLAAAKSEHFDLNPKHKVLPVSDSRSAELVAEAEEKILAGEHEIDTYHTDVSNLRYQNKIEISTESKSALTQADYIVVCPGSWHTSILPIFLVEGFEETAKESHGKIIFVENIGEQNYSPEVIKNYFGRPADFVIKSEGMESGETIKADPNDPLPRSARRHDPPKLAKEIEKIFM